MADTSQIENNTGLLIWKTSNFWQSNLRKILLPFNITLNEYLILMSIKLLLFTKDNTYQNEIAEFVGVNVSVASVTFKLLEKKKYIIKIVENDNRKKIINITEKGDIIFNKIHPLIQKQENFIFNKLNNESFNFTNSLKLILGKKIRIKAEKYSNYDRI